MLQRFLTSAVDGLDRIAAPVAERLLRPQVFLTLVTLYVLALFLIKAALYTGGMGHDVDQLILSQSLAFGYDNRNPPLYTWLVYAAENLLGPSRLAVMLVKSVLIFLIYLFLYRAAALMLEDRRMAVLAALAPFALYQFSLQLPLKYSHTALLAAACAATLYLVLRLERRRATVDYLLLGLGIGLGLLSKYNYAIFLAALLIACQFDPVLRGAIRSRGMLVAVAVAVLLVAPHVYWVLVEAPDFGQAASARFRTGSDNGLLERLALGLGSGARGLLVFVLPLGVVLPFLAWRAHRAPADDGGQADLRRRIRLLSLAMLILAAAIVILVAASGTTLVRKHYLFIFIPFPIWVVLWFQALRLSQAAVARFALACAALAPIMPLAMAASFWIQPLTEDYPEYNLAYADLAAALRASGFEQGTIFAHEYPYTLSGNLRPHLPEARFVGSSIPHDPPPRQGGNPGDSKTAGACLLVWAEDRSSTEESKIRKVALQRFGADAETAAKTGAVEIGILNGGGRSVLFRYRFYPEGLGTCR